MWRKRLATELEEMARRKIYASTNRLLRVISSRLQVWRVRLIELELADAV